MKLRFFRHLRGGADPDAERLYRWHIEKRSGARLNAGMATDQWKLTLDHYVTAATQLHASMASLGFSSRGAVPLDPDGELLGGAHRVACALALDVPVVVVDMPQRVWAPPWGWDWFIDAGIGWTDAKRLIADWNIIHGRTGGLAGR